MFFVCLVAFGRGGLSFDAALAPMIVCLMAFDAAGLVALIPYTQESDSVSFTGISVYITFTTILFATIVARDPLERMKAIRSGYMFAGMLAAILAILGYFNIAGLGPHFTLYDNQRAMGPFKDPNVFAPFLVAPIAWVCQDLLLRRGAVVWNTIELVVLLTALLLSFSRGAVIDAVFALLLILAMTYLTSGSARLRRRTVVTAVACIAMVAALVAIALMVPAIRDLATERATLSEDYDTGEQGRFGNQIRSIPLLLELPFGFGPYRFSKYFPADPHEVFLSAFASFGWVGGIAFAVFMAMTLYVGFVFAFRRTRRANRGHRRLGRTVAANPAGRADRHLALAPSVHAGRLSLRAGRRGAARGGRARPRHLKVRKRRRRRSPPCRAGSAGRRPRAWRRSGVLCIPRWRPRRRAAVRSASTPTGASKKAERKDAAEAGSGWVNVSDATPVAPLG